VVVDIVVVELLAIGLTLWLTDVQAVSRVVVWAALVALPMAVAAALRGPAIGRRSPS
jgi:hypothetical protein